MRDRVERLLEVHEAHTEWLLILACLVRLVRPQKSSSDFNEIWCVDRGWWLMHVARWYAVWPNPKSRSRSWGFWSSKNCTSSKFDLAGFLLFVLVFVSRDLELGESLWIVRPQKSFSDFNEIWYVDRARWVMHKGLPYYPIQGQAQAQGHECLKATQEESTISPARN